MIGAFALPVPLAFAVTFLILGALELAAERLRR